MMIQATQKWMEKLLANTFVLSLKSKNFHWNVRGPNFFSLHTLFEGQYTELDAALDTIAESIRQNGLIVQATLTFYNQAADIQSVHGDISANDMLKALAADHQLLVDTITNALGPQGLDLTPGQEDLLITRLAAHKKAHWMLESSLA
jgi:starvation-inducible DNA-binding protein